MLPEHATVIEADGTSRSRLLHEIAPGTTIWVDHGNQVPLDGRVSRGEANLDESALTGESVWVRRRPGDTVFAGTMNHGPGFELVTTAAMDATRIAGIADLAGRAQAGKPPVARLADRIARRFVPAVLLLAAGTWTAWQPRHSHQSCPLLRRTRSGRARVFLALDGAPVARFDICDPVRVDAADAVEGPKLAGLQVTMVSGDAPERCAALASQLGIAFAARQAPETKLEIARQLKAEGHTVLVLGDGINDVPVLAGADVAAAVLESSHLVEANAGVLLLSRRLGALVELVDVSRRARRIIHQNLFWALAYNLTPCRWRRSASCHPGWRHWEWPAADAGDVRCIAPAGGPPGSGDTADGRGTTLTASSP